MLDSSNSNEEGKEDEEGKEEEEEKKECRKESERISFALQRKRPELPA